MSILARLAAAGLIILLVIPVLAGMAGILAPALGYLPAAGATTLSAGPVLALLAIPGLGQSAWLSFATGLAGTAIALLLAAITVATVLDRPAFALIRRLLSPLLAIPHAAAAFGIAAIAAPSGLLSRLASPWATGWTRPPDIAIIGDQSGLALMASVALKEAPFLVLMLIAALPQADATRRVLEARMLGYGRVRAFMLAAWPALYPQIRLAVLAVLAFATSTVDMALILGPTNPPTLPVVVLRLAADADLALRPVAAAAALLQTLVVAAALLVWLGAEQAGRHLRAAASRSGRRGPAGRASHGVQTGLGLAAASLPAAAILGGLATLALWSIAGPWFYPAALPQGLTLATWTATLAAFSQAILNTLLLGGTAALVATALAALSLDNERRMGRSPPSWARLVLYAPLLVPQIGFMFGLSVLAIGTGLDRGFAGVLLAHLVFVCPYAYLSLHGPWRAFDERLDLTAATLGAGPWRRFRAVRVPILLRPLLTAAALGFSVSVAQYLPTLLVAGGRFPTVTTEAVALAAGNDRRVIGAAALLQALLPGLAFALALAIPAFVHRHRAGMNGRWT